MGRDGALTGSLPIARKEAGKLIKIKLSANDVRTVRGAQSEAELEGAIEMIRERITQAEQEKVFGREPKKTKAEKGPSPYNWQSARDVLRGVLGEDLKAPPYPDPIWYQRIHRTLKQYGMQEEDLIKLAEYVKEHLRPPYSMDFIVCQHERILAGHFDSQAKKGSSTGATYVVPNWRNNVLPEE